MVMPALTLQTANLECVRNIPRWLFFACKDDTGAVFDNSLITHVKLIVSHAQTTNPADRVIVYTNDFLFTPARVERFLTFNELDAMPLGQFLYELLISDDDVFYSTAFQGTIAMFPSLWQQFGS
jgi:hypothetical protein